jgi:uncharacterized protein (TIGR02271 family)
MATYPMGSPMDRDLTTGRIVGFFTKREDAYEAITALKASGFTSDEIGLIAGGTTSPAGTQTTARDDRSLWDKIKDFFKGEPGHSDSKQFHNTASDLEWSDERSQYYYRGINSGGALVSVWTEGARLEKARRILEQHGADLRQSGFPAYTSEASGLEAQPEQRIELHGEILRIHKDRIQRGEVRVRKEVVTENQNVEVPVNREELVIERTPVEGREADTGTFETGEKEIRVPLTQEQVRVEKKPVVTEELRVGKRQVQDTKKVADSVRHEEVRVEKEGDVTDTEVDELTKDKKRRIA